MKRAFPDPAPRIFKACASGNDFLLADARQVAGWDPGAAAARALCRRHDGLGADGLIVLGSSTIADASFFLRNSDGSTAALSGNGARCAALLLHELGVRRDGGRIDLELASGTCSARVLRADEGEEARVEVSIGAPRDVRLDLELPPGFPVRRADHAIVGVPYLAVRVAGPLALATLDLPRVAPPLRSWAALPDGANVAFFADVGPNSLVPLRTWERGVEGETQSSGTGCAMVALSLALRRPATWRVELLPPSGARLAVTIVREGDAVADLRLEGDARIVAEMLPLPGALLDSP